jgi:sucrose-phosphate synthase
LQEKKLNILIINIHGLFRAHNLELGRDLDTGGQTKYVYEYAKELGKQKGINKVYVITRYIKDKRVSPDYAKEIEPISDNVGILRIKCNGSHYIKKEKLWVYLDEFVENTIRTIIAKDMKVDLIHSHYADSGYVAMKLSKILDVAFMHTGHSLGIPKMKKLQENNVDQMTMDIDYKITHRIAVEEEIIKKASLIITSTKHEIENQYAMYKSFAEGTYEIIAPGIDVDKFYPYYFLQDYAIKGLKDYEFNFQMREIIRKGLRRFLVKPDKPLILTICRPEKRKNIEGLIEAYGNDKELQAIANLAIFAGIRKDIATKNRLEQRILMDMLLLMDKYDLYGKLAIPKKHNAEIEIPELYRYTAQLGGVFVNPSYIEPFGLTLLEASASGLPIIATNNGGPKDIIKTCNNGELVDVTNPSQIAKAIKKIITNAELWSTYANNGIISIKENYSWESHCRHLLKKINEMHIVSNCPLPTRKLEGTKKDAFSLAKKIIMTDIDNTLIGSEHKLSMFLDWFKINKENYRFGVATGRSIDSALSVLKEQKVPIPDILITSVGTEIYYNYFGKLIPI